VASWGGKEGEQEENLVWVDRIAGVRGGVVGRKGKGSKKITWSGLTG
jgi:hypothetical protein